MGRKGTLRVGDIERARELFLASEMNLREVAELCGYDWKHLRHVAAQGKWVERRKKIRAMIAQTAEKKVVEKLAETRASLAMKNVQLLQQVKTRAVEAFHKTPPIFEDMGKAISSITAVADMQDKLMKPVEAKPDDDVQTVEIVVKHRNSAERSSGDD